MQESLLKIRREQRDHLKRELGQAKEGNGPGGLGCRVFKTRSLIDSLD